MGIRNDDHLDPDIHDLRDEEALQHAVDERDQHISDLLRTNMELRDRIFDLERAIVRLALRAT